MALWPRCRGRIRARMKPRFATRLRACRLRCIEHSERRSFDLSSGSARVRCGSSGYLARRDSSGSFAPGKPQGCSPDGRGRLSLGLVLTIVVVAFEGLAVATIMPITALALRGLALYAWSFSGFMVGSLVGTVAVGEYAERHGPAPVECREPCPDSRQIFLKTRRRPGDL
jgi:hypothetical protein